ncbi:c-type cytochrome [Campylobacter portucalensis]|uniref:c-type cytochrome n=1 Tax=Campylobacter portucalensis TaxID=2608384 RepID=UPI001E531998|nr:cytochrome C [Campylobacter portucalensis]
MYRLIKAAQFIKQNMPQYNAILTNEEAFDVASYINTQKRPIKANRDKDFPDRRIKAIDMDVGPHDDKFSDEEHRFGPYKQMLK